MGKLDNVHVRWAPLSKKLEIVRTKPVKGKDHEVVQDRRDAQAEVMHAVIEMMRDGLEELPDDKDGWYLSFRMGDDHYDLILKLGEEPEIN